MSHDQKPARVRVIGGGTDPGRRRTDAAALGGRFASGPAPRVKPAVAKATGRISLWLAVLFLIGSLIGGVVQALLVVNL